VVKSAARRTPKTLVQIIGRPSLEVTRVRVGRLRRNGCGEAFTANEPAEAGAKKYDETVVAMIAQLRYGSGVPFELRLREEHSGPPEAAICS